MEMEHYENASYLLLPRGIPDVKSNYLVANRSRLCQERGTGI